MNCLHLMSIFSAKLSRYRFKEICDSFENGCKNKKKVKKNPVLVHVDCWPKVVTAVVFVI